MTAVGYIRPTPDIHSWDSMTPSKEISFSDARALATLQAKAMLGTLEYDVLSQEYAEAEGCWIFFRSRKFAFPPHMTLASSAAYAVSKRGEVRTVADFSDSPDELNSLLALLSAFFLRKEGDKPCTQWSTQS